MNADALHDASYEHVNLHNATWIGVFNQMLEYIIVIIDIIVILEK